MEPLQPIFWGAFEVPNISTNLVQALAITIDYMGTETLPSLKPAMLWMSGLPYPWCDVSVVAKEPPKIPAVMRVMEQLRK